MRASRQQVDNQDDDKDGNKHATADDLGSRRGFVHHFVGRGKQFPLTLHMKIKFIDCPLHGDDYTTNA